MGLYDFLARTEILDFCRKFLLGKGKSFLIVLQSLDLLPQAVRLRDDKLFTLQCNASQVFASCLNGALSLVRKLRLVAFQLCCLHFQTPLGRNHLHDAALDFVQLLELPFICVVKRLCRVFTTVQQRVNLGAEHSAHPRKDTHSHSSGSATAPIRVKHNCH